MRSRYPCCSSAAIAGAPTPIPPPGRSARPWRSSASACASSPSSSAGERLSERYRVGQVRVVEAGNLDDHVFAASNLEAAVLVGIHEDIAVDAVIADQHRMPGEARSLHAAAQGSKIPRAADRAHRPAELHPAEVDDIVLGPVEIDDHVGLAEVVAGAEEGIGRLRIDER